MVVEGPKAGGHLGFKIDQIEDKAYCLENLIPEVVKETKIYEESSGKSIPVIAAGGIYTGGDIHNIMALGATAVQMGTRFVATHECDASDEFKNSYVNASERDVRIIKSPVGMPGRAIINQFFREVDEGIRKPKTCRHHCIITCDHKVTPYCIANALVEAQKGNLKEGFAFAGSNVHLVNEIISVNELFEILDSEYNRAAENSE